MKGRREGRGRWAGAGAHLIRDPLQAARCVDLVVEGKGAGEGDVDDGRVGVGVGVVEDAESGHRGDGLAGGPRGRVEGLEDLGAALHLGERGVGNGGGEGRGGGGEAVAGTGEALVVDHLAGADAEAADGAEHRVEGPHHDLDVGEGEPGVLDGAAAAGAEGAEGAALVDDEAEAEALLEGDDRAQGGDVARVAVEALHLGRRGAG